MSKTVAIITLKFLIHDEEEVLELGRSAAESQWGNLDPLNSDAPLASALAEYLVLSNAEVCPGGFLNYGIELLATETEDVTA